MHGWDITDGGIWLFKPSTVAVIRYRYRGAKIPNPWTTPTSTPRLVESQMQ